MEVDIIGIISAIATMFLACLLKIQKMTDPRYIVEKEILCVKKPIPSVEEISSKEVEKHRADVQECVDFISNEIRTRSTTKGFSIPFFHLSSTYSFKTLLVKYFDEVELKFVENGRSLELDEFGLTVKPLLGDEY